MTERLFNTRDAALILGVSQRTIRDRIKRGELKAHRVPGRPGELNKSHWRIPQSSIDTWLQANTYEPLAAPRPLVGNPDVQTKQLKRAVEILETQSLYGDREVVTKDILKELQEALNELELDSPIDLEE